MSNNILITGGAGFIGRHLISTLVLLDFSVRVLDVVSENEFFGNFDSLPKDLVKYTQGEVSDVGLLKKLLNDCRLCIHLVSTTVPVTSNLDMVFDVSSNVVNMIKLLEVSRAAGLSKIIYLSSGGAVYGNPLYSPLDEYHPVNPISSYGVTKLACEKYLLLYNHLYGFKNLVLRVSNPYGPGQSLNGVHGAISTFVKSAVLGEVIDIYGDGLVTRDYIYIDDLVSSIVCAVKYEGNYSVFNIGSGQETSLLDLISVIQSALQKKLSVKHLPPRGFDVKKNVLDISLATRQLSWSPKFPLELGLPRFVNNLIKKNECNK